MPKGGTKMIEIDDLKKDIYVTVTGFRDTVRQERMNLFGEVVGTTSRSELEGRVLHVLALSLPFVVVEEQETGKRLSLDTRRFKFARITTAYRKAMRQPKVKEIIKPDESDAIEAPQWYGIGR
jgi:hypothetical protein